ncbi:t-SNARE VTI1 [Microbotryomycetes sp. JL201]|nr:t-SNARE VTI1 [Microbotryomycetes sp. JL201]
MAAPSPLMAGSVFQEYETDLEQLTSSVKAKLSEEARDVRGDARGAVLRRVERELEEADEIIAQMEIEVQTADRDERDVLQSQLKQHKASIAQQKAELASTRHSRSTAAMLTDLLGPNSEHTAIDMDRSDSSNEQGSQAQLQRSRLLSTTDKLSEGQRRLEDSHRVALETEVLGADILNNLRGQRDQLEHTRDTLYEADGSIDRASGTLKKMIRRAQKQRLVTYGIIAILVFLILYVLFSKLFG